MSSLNWCFLFKVKKNKILITRNHTKPITQLLICKFKNLYLYSRLCVRQLRAAKIRKYNKNNSILNLSKSENKQRKNLKFFNSSCFFVRNEISKRSCGRVREWWRTSLCYGVCERTMKGTQQRNVAAQPLHPLSSHTHTPSETRRHWLRCALLEKIHCLPAGALFCELAALHLFLFLLLLLLLQFFNANAKATHIARATIAIANAAWRLMLQLHCNVLALGVAYFVALRCAFLWSLFICVALRSLFLRLAHS